MERNAEGRIPATCCSNHGNGILDSRKCKQEQGLSYVVLVVSKDFGSCIEECQWRPVVINFLQCAVMMAMWNNVKVITHKAGIVLQDPAYSQKDVCIPCSHSEACSSSSHSADEAVSIKTEEFFHVQDMEAEREVSCVSTVTHIWVTSKTACSLPSPILCLSHRTSSLVNKFLRTLLILSFDMTS
jgi:hypothetical protein